MRIIDVLGEGLRDGTAVENLRIVVVVGRLRCRSLRSRHPDVIVATGQECVFEVRAKFIDGQLQAARVKQSYVGGCRIRHGYVIRLAYQCLSRGRIEAIEINVAAAPEAVIDLGRMDVGTGIWSKTRGDGSAE